MLVLGPQEWEQMPALQELVRRAPEPMLKQIIFYGVGAPLAEQLRQLRPEVELAIIEEHVEHGLSALTDQLGELVVRVDGSKVSVFNHDLAELLRFVLRGVPAEIIELRLTDSFRLILAAMGAAQPALDRVDADRLEQALSRLASA